ncbi:site-specific DNA-methyltransferase [Rhizobium sp. TRM95001]|nr:site-specific DNA-methyltransferase [Rhizobium halophilum]MCF6370796.1 site-specific DNA-methyltransferase [Rhizobium halophilum]
MGKRYEKADRFSEVEYRRFMEAIVEVLKQKLQRTGSVCWQVGNQVRDNEIFPLDYLAYQVFFKQGFKLRNRIIWRFNFGLNNTARFSGRYETVLWFTRGDNYKFNLDPVRIPQLYPGKRHAARKASKAGTPSGNPLGKNPSDFWEFRPVEAFEINTVWEIPNVKAAHPEKTMHPCQFPVELVERCVLALTDTGDLVVDPFVGVGASVIAAEKHGRRALGIERDLNYAMLARERLRQFRQGELTLRPLGKPVTKPNVNQKVAHCLWSGGMARRKGSKGTKKLSKEELADRRRKAAHKRLVRNASAR